MKSRATASLRKKRDRHEQKQAVAEGEDVPKHKPLTKERDALDLARQAYGCEQKQSCVSSEKKRKWCGGVCWCTSWCNQTTHDTPAGRTLTKERDALVLARQAYGCEQKQSCVSSEKKRKWCGGVCWCTSWCNHTTHDTPAGRTRGTVEIQFRDSSRCNPFSSSSSDENPEQQTIMFVGMILYKKALSKHQRRTAECTQPVPCT